MIQKPNIFYQATSELSQDAFLKWFIQWGDNRYYQYNDLLCNASKEFIKFILNKPTGFAVNSVKAGRQLKHIDVYAIVNDEHLILIEDKTKTTAHSNQLENYRNFFTGNEQFQNYELSFIYIKTGNECSSSLQEVESNGYKVVLRRDILKILNKYPIRNEIYDDFKEYLNDIEDQTLSFNKFKVLTSNRLATEGFFMKLQTMIDGWHGWNYVANKSNGFMGFWYHFVDFTTFRLNIHIENPLNGDFLVFVKIGDWQPDIGTLYQVNNDLKGCSVKFGIQLTKPKRFKKGNHSTVAVLLDSFNLDNEGKFDFDFFYDKLKKLEKTLDYYQSIYINSTIDKTYKDNIDN